MAWLIVDVVLVVLPVALLGLVGLGLYRQAKALLRTVEQATEALGAASDPDPRPVPGTTPPVHIGGAQSSRRG